MAGFGTRRLYRQTLVWMEFYKLNLTISVRRYRSFPTAKPKYYKEI